MSSNHLKTMTCRTFASRAGGWVRLSQAARSLMTLGVTATHDSASLRPSRWIFALRRTRLLLIAAAVAFGVLWMLGTIAAVPALVGFAAIAAAALIVAVNTEPAPAPAPVIRDQPSPPGLAAPPLPAVLSAGPGSPPAPRPPPPAPPPPAP